MAYIGNQPTEAFTTFATQTFSTSATSSYTLDHAVTNENEIALFINNVRQQPGSGKAYTATGTALTLSANTASTDTMYCVFLGRALQTVNPPAGSVGSSQIAAEMITGQTALAAEPADTDEFLVSDAGVLKRMDYSYIKGGGASTLLSTTTISADTANIVFNSSVITSSYKRFMLDFDALILDAQGKINMKISSNNGSSYKTASNYTYSSFSIESAGNNRNQADGAGSDGFQLFADTTSATTRPNNFRMFIYDPLNTSTFFSYSVNGISHDAQDDAMPFIAGGFYKTDSGDAHNAIKFTPESGNFDSGVIRFYGIS